MPFLLLHMSRYIEPTPGMESTTTRPLPVESTGTSTSKKILPSSQEALSRVSLPPPLAGTEYTIEPTYLFPDPSDFRADTFVPSLR